MATGAAAAGEESLYGLLQLPPTATPADVRGAFRRLSRALHPDKHQGSAAKAAATDAFARVKEAHEILSDARLRRVYDAFGLSAARSAASPQNELVPYAQLAQRFADEAAAGAAPGGGHAQADPYFTVANTLEPRVDATGLVAALEDGAWDDGRLAVLSQVALSTQATVYATESTTLSAQYSLMNRPRTVRPGPQFPSAPHAARRGGLVSAGEMALSARRILDAHSAADAAAFLPLDPRDGVTLTGKVFRALSDSTSAALDATYTVRDRGLTLALSATRRMSARVSANVSWSAGAAPGFGFSVRRDAYDEYVDTEARTRKAAAESDARADPFGGVESGDESDESDEEDATWEDDRFGAAARPRRRRRPLRKDSELLPVAALVRGMRPLAVLVSPHVWAPVGARLSLNPGLGEGNVALALRRPVGKHAPFFAPSEPEGPGGGYVKLRTSLGVGGWEVEAGGGQKYVTVDTAWGTSVAIGTHGVMLRLRLQRGGHRFQVPIVLVSTVADARTATIAAMTSSAIVSAIQILIVQPIQERREAAERSEAKQGRMDMMKRAKSDAEASRELMSRVVSGSVERETAAPEGGLIVERAIYGLRRVVEEAALASRSFAGREIDAEATEVTDCVQMLVEDSRVQIVSSTKSTILGFWDPTALGDDDKALRIWYRFRGALHLCTVADHEPLELPLSTHKLA